MFANFKGWFLGESPTPNLPAIHFRDTDGTSNQHMGSNILALSTWINVLAPALLGRSRTIVYFLSVYSIKQFSCLVRWWLQVDDLLFASLHQPINSFLCSLSYPETSSILDLVIVGCFLVWSLCNFKASSWKDVGWSGVDVWCEQRSAA